MLVVRQEEENTYIPFLNVCIPLNPEKSSKKKSDIIITNKNAKVIIIL